MSETKGAKRADSIARALRYAIIEQALPVGSRLPEDTIGEQFCVSRTIVREALAVLAAEGLVEHRRNRGAFVAEPSWEEALEVFEMRIALEKLVVSRLAGSLDEAQIAKLRAFVDDEDRALKEKKHALSIRLGGEFHVSLAELTGSKFLMRYTREFTSKSTLILALYSRPVSVECGVAEHRAIIDYLASGARDDAVAAMTRHLGAVADRAMIKPKENMYSSIADVLKEYGEIGSE
ncbi:MAG: GntR family transcriptional regulator [Flavobacteriaceae bacterium]